MVELGFERRLESALTHLGGLLLSLREPRQEAISWYLSFHSSKMGVVTAVSPGTGSGLNKGQVPTP